MSLLKFPKKSHSKSSVRSNLGQGLVEYILILSVTVIIILGLAQRLYKPLGDFVESFMGTYVACLLETGELPRFGTDEPSSGECRPPAMGEGETVDVAEGRPVGEGRQVGEGRPIGEGREVGEGRPVGDGRGAGAGGLGGGRFGNRRTTVGAAGAGGGDGGSGRGGRTRRVEIALEGGGSGSFFSSQQGGGGRSIYRRGDRYVAVTGAMAEEIERRQPQRNQAGNNRQRVEAGTGGVEVAMPKRQLVQQTQNRNRGPTSDDEIGTLDISQIVKYILIAGIIIILLVLLGGQALQLSKSWEKGE